jgi:hypothetical protein
MACVGEAVHLKDLNTELPSNFVDGIPQIFIDCIDKIVAGEFQAAAQWLIEFKNGTAPFFSIPGIVEADDSVDNVARNLENHCRQIRETCEESGDNVNKFVKNHLLGSIHWAYEGLISNIYYAECAKESSSVVSVVNYLNRTMDDYAAPTPAFPSFQITPSPDNPAFVNKKQDPIDYGSYSDGDFSESESKLSGKVGKKVPTNSSSSVSTDSESSEFE